MAGAVEETPECRFYNAAMWFDGGELLHVHRKVYLPTYGLFDEVRYFARGDRICASIAASVAWRCCSARICGTRRRRTSPRSTARSRCCAVGEPDLGARGRRAAGERAYWQRINDVTAETFGMHLVYANRVGFEDGVGFWGGSEIVGPTGEILARAKYYEPDMIAAEMNLAAVRRKRIASPMLRDENVDLTINELVRIRGGRAAAGGEPPATGAVPASVPKPARVARPERPRVAVTTKARKSAKSARKTARRR